MGLVTVQDVALAKHVLSARMLNRRATGERGTEFFRGCNSRHVHAIGIGRKITGGDQTSAMCVRVYVTEKCASTSLGRRERIPSAIDGIPTDVIVSVPAIASATALSRSPLPSLQDRAPLRRRPLVGGISAAHSQVFVGTLGYFCHSTRTGEDPDQVFLLSNSHIFANMNAAMLGEDVYQPALGDGGTSADSCAVLHQFVPIRLGGIAPNRVDAALAKLRSGVAYTAEIETIGRVNGIAVAEVGTLVCKHGRTSGYTVGEVSDVSYDVLVSLDHQDPAKVALFENQIRIERAASSYAAFASGGDSGALVVCKESNAAIGLYFSGAPGGEYGVANHIQDVIAALQIRLV